MDIPAKEVCTNYVSFDLEISKMLPDDSTQWKEFRPLGISCAALQFDGEDPRLWTTKLSNGQFAEKMSRDDLQRLVKYLVRAVDNGWQIVTWNGLGFDFDILAEESGCWAECRYLALNHIDMMFQFFCKQGYPLGLNKAAIGMGLLGKSEGMSGNLVPVLWQQGEYQTVLEYVAQDAVTTLEVAKAVLAKGQINWISNSGRYQQVSFPEGWLTVMESAKLPYPDTSWMMEPMKREKFWDWTLEKSGNSPEDAVSDLKAPEKTGLLSILKRVIETIAKTIKPKNYKSKVSNPRSKILDQSEPNFLPSNSVAENELIAVVIPDSAIGPVVEPIEPELSNTQGTTETSQETKDEQVFKVIEAQELDDVLQSDPKQDSDLHLSIETIVHPELLNDISEDENIPLGEMQPVSSEAIVAGDSVELVQEEPSISPEVILSNGVIPKSPEFEARLQPDQAIDIVPHIQEQVTTDSVELETTLEDKSETIEDASPFNSSDEIIVNDIEELDQEQYEVTLSNNDMELEPDLNPDESMQTEVVTALETDSEIDSQAQAQNEPHSESFATIDSLEHGDENFVITTVEEEKELTDAEMFLDEEDLPDSLNEVEVIEEEVDDQSNSDDLGYDDHYDLNNEVDDGNIRTDIQLPDAELIRPMHSVIRQPSKKDAFVRKHTRTGYYARFIDQRYIAPHLEEEEIDDFLKNIEADHLSEFLRWPPHQLENYLYHAIQRNEFLGELPISNLAFSQLAEYIRYNAKIKGKLDPKRIPPVLFLVGMVFCARYSETDARRFWEPYANLVWGLDEASLSFQQKCRKHFINCREDLSNTLSLKFNYIKDGDVVRPIYQHAIIPNYLQDHFANWLVDNFKDLLRFPAEQLPRILKEEKSLDYLPQSLRDFIRSGDTEETAARLIIQMAKAVNLFYETEQAEAVESVINSSIERSIWRAIYQKLIVEQSQLVQIRKIAPRLQWVWNLEDDDVYLNISNVRSGQSEKPDSIIWAEKDATYLKGEEIFLKLYPWKLSSGDWELDSMNLPGDGPTEGSILVLSEEFDLDESKETQPGHIVFEKEVPLLQDKIMFFRINSRTNEARKRDQLDSEGEWIIVAKQSIQVINQFGHSISQSPICMPSRLREAGYSVAARYDIQIPVTIQVDEETRVIERSSEKIQLLPYFEGYSKIENLSEGLPPIFLSSEISLRFLMNLKDHPLHRTWLSIQRGGEFVQSILLADLQKRGSLLLEENNCTIFLGRLLSKPGSYNINLLHNLKSLLDEPVKFAWLPEQVKVSSPDPNAVYSPINPLQIVIQGISENQFISYQEEKIKVKEEDGGIKVEWKVLKDPLCRFAINWEDSLIRFAWDIQRVSAWVEGGGDKNQVLEGQEREVKVQVRGYSHETYCWIIENSELQRRTQLNAKGELCTSLFESELRDMLQEYKQFRSNVSIDIHGFTWKLFEHLKNVSIEITSVTYQNSELKIDLKQSRKILGNYRIQVRDLVRTAQVLKLDDLNTLDDHLHYSLDLVPGTYRVEILLDNEPVHSSPEFVVKGAETVEEEVHQIEIQEEYGSPTHLFKLLTAGKQELHALRYDRLPITPAIEQLQIIHSEDEWLTDDKLEKGLKRLLPSWAVLMYPLRFTTKDHRKVLHVFPEQVAYGGKAGKGYVELKIEQERMRICAFWKPVSDTEYSELWMSVPEKSEIKRYCECDPMEAWPVYQCVDCGTIVASRSGTCLKLPPSIVQMHRHGEDRKPTEQFIDTVYRSHVAVGIIQYKDRNLSHQAYWAKDVVYQGYLQLLLDGKARPIHGDLAKPINLYSTADYGCAVSELHKNIQDLTRLPFIDQILENANNLDLLDFYFSEENLRVPAFNAMGRLAHYLSVSDQVQNIPANILVLSMTLRLKNNLPKEYKDLLTYTGLAESELQQFAYAAAQACPKLLEWTIAWAELFYVHAIS